MAAKLIGERLPQNWSYAVTGDGRIFFIDDGSRKTTWLYPVTQEPVQTGFSSVQDELDYCDFRDLLHVPDHNKIKILSGFTGLPIGWEQALTIDGAVYFIDHNRHITTFDHPLTGHSAMEGSFQTPPQSPLGRGNQNRKPAKSLAIKPPAAAREQTSKVIMKGWLQKQESGGLKLWKKKWCVLADFGLFFYKDENEQNCIGSILLPSYKISPCSPQDVSKKFAFKAEHENMKTFYFCTEKQWEMEKWLEALKMAALVQRAPGSSNIPKLIPKSPIMTWDDNKDNPRDIISNRHQYPFTNSDEIASRSVQHVDDSISERPPLQPNENSRQLNSYHKSEPVPNAREFQWFSRDNKDEASSRSNQGQKLPDDQRSLSISSQRSGQISTSTLSRNARLGHEINDRGNGPFQGQGYQSLPRDARLLPGSVAPDSNFSSRQAHERQSLGSAPSDERRPIGKKDDNPYMMMSSPLQQKDNRKMDPMKHSNRPLPQEPQPVPMTGKVQSSGSGDYASLTRIREKWSNQKLSDSGPPSQTTSNLSPMQQKRPDLYIDIPHTYVNVYDESQVRDKPPDLPMRPPLPNEMRHLIVEDIAKAHSPNTQPEIMIAENNLEQRMKQPPFFNYSVPESRPTYPQDSQRSQNSKRSQMSRLPQEQDRQPQLPRRPDAPMLSSPEVRQDVANTYPAPNKYLSNMSADYNNSNTTLTNEDDRNDKISEFYGLAKYNDKSKQYGEYGKDKNRFLSDIDVRNYEPPLKPLTCMTGEKDFRLRSLPDHVQSMPALYHDQQALPNDMLDRQPQTFQHTMPNSQQRTSQSDLPNRQQQMFQQTMPNNQQKTSQNDMPNRKQLMFPNDMTNKPHGTNTYMNISPNYMNTGSDSMTPSPRQSAFRSLSVGSDSSRRTSSDGNSINGYSSFTHHVDPNKPMGYNQEQMDIKRLSAVSSQKSQPRLPLKQDALIIPSEPMGKGYYKPQGQRGSRMPQTIHTVKEDEDMPDSQVIETDLPPKVFPLNGPRLRMSISATDLLGKTHDELVLLLIQLRRDKAELTEQRNGIRKSLQQSQPVEFYYQKLQNENRSIDADKESQHKKYQELKHKFEDVEKKLEVYKPLVNLICNMVTMGSLYGGDNLMLATEYRKHLLSPDQYSPPKKMIEFSRRHQEDVIIQEIEEDVKELTKKQADLQEKLERLNKLDRIMQNQSFQVSSLKEDREMLEKALGGLLKMQEQHFTNPSELDELVHQQKTVEKELSRVLQQLAVASKELEETTAENNKLEHEAALLRTNAHGSILRSKSAPSLSGESLQTKMKMEKDLARVKNIMEGLSEEGAKLQEMMSSLRRLESGSDTQQSPVSPFQKSFPIDSAAPDKKTQNSSTYFETDLDTCECKDLAQVTALLATYHLLPSQSGRELSQESLSHKANVNSYSSQLAHMEESNNAFITLSLGDDSAAYQPTAVKASVQHLQPKPDPKADSGDQWDIDEAEDNTKRFFGLIPKNMPKQQTVRDVKRQAESRKKKEDDPPSLRVSVIPSDYPDSTHHVYENLPQQKSATVPDKNLPWASISPGEDIPTSTTRRRSNMHLLTAKPFTPYNSKPPFFSSVSSLSSLYNNTNLHPIEAPVHNNNTLLSQSQPSLFENKFESTQLNNSYKPSEPIISQNSSKTPPPPPVRGTSKLYTTSQQNLRDTFMNKLANGNFEPSEAAILKKGKINRNSQKTRYMTISSSEPIKLEQSLPHSPKLHSQAGDLISSMEVPDIVKSSTARSDMFDDKTIDREILFFPEKVDIPERYTPESDEDDNLTEEERGHRQEKADKIKKILTNQSIHSLSQPDVSKVAGEVHERVQQEKQKRAFLLGINQELAEQVKLKSRQIAADRRKTWSGSTKKSEVNPSEADATDTDEHNNHEVQHDDDRKHSDVKQNEDRNNNSLNVNINASTDNSDNAGHYYTKDNSPYRQNSSVFGQDSHNTRQLQVDNLFSNGDHSDSSSFPYNSKSYHVPTYIDEPNFKI